MKHGAGIILYTGNELYLIRGAYDSVKRESCLTLAHSRYVLCEFPMTEPPGDDSLYELEMLISSHYVPILAHAERYEWFAKEFDLFHALMERGCLFQVNSGSIKGLYGKSVCMNAEKLLDADMVAFINSDSYDVLKRKPLMKDTNEWITRKYDIWRAE
jgi:protein-tyrosine phosphatase